MTSAGRNSHALAAATREPANSLDRTPMKKPVKMASWDDPELDRMWRQMYELEMSMDDTDLLLNSPKLQHWESLNRQFKAHMQLLDTLKGK